MTSKGSRGSSTRDVSSGQGDRLYLDVRLVVRRVRPTPGSQLALDVAFSYHAFITDRDGQLLDIEADHRRHAVVEQVERVTAENVAPDRQDEVVNAA